MRLFDAVGAVVVASWALLAASYAYNIYSQGDDPATAIASDKVTMTEGESWMILSRASKDVGYIHETRTVVEGGWLLEYEMFTLIELMGVPQVIDTRMKATVDRDAVLRQFFGSVNSIIGNMQVKGEVKGLELTMTMDLQGKKSEQKLTLKQPPRLASNALNQILAGPTPRPGQIFEQEFFDPVSMGMNKLVYEFVELKEVSPYDVKWQSFHFVQKMMGTELDVYVSKEGEILIQELPMFTVAAKIANDLGRVRAPAIRRDIEKRMKDVKVNTPEDLIKQIEKQNGVAANPLTQSGLMANALDFASSAFGGNDAAAGDAPAAYIVAALPADASLSLESERQRLPADGASGALLIGSFSDDARRAGTRPWSQGPIDPAPLLAASPRLDHAHASIAALGKVADGTAPSDAIRAIVRKVATTLKLGAPSKDVSSASAILASGESDATGAAVVLVAALRAAKIPARFVVGLLRADSGESRPHVWVQAWDGARFIDLDLTREDLLATGPQVQLLTVDDLDPAALSQPPLAALLALKLEPAPKAP